MFDTLTQRGITISLVKPALVTGTGHSISTTVTSSHVCNGKFQTPVTAITNGALPTTDYNTGVAFQSLTGIASGGGQGTVVVYAFKEGATGASEADIRCMMGSIETLDSAGNFLRPPQFPTIKGDICPFAYQILKEYGEAQVATFGTTDWDAGDHFVNSIVHVAQLPIAPQVA